MVCPVLCTAYDKYLIVGVLSDCFNQFKHACISVVSMQINLVGGFLLEMRFVKELVEN